MLFWTQLMFASRILLRLWGRGALDAGLLLLAGTGRHLLGWF